MKRLYALLFVLCSIPAHAQLSNAFKNEMETIFQYVNRSPVTTGLLGDYGIYFSNIEKYNGVPTDSNYVNYAEWQSLYNSIYSCRFNGNASLPVPATLYRSADSLANLFTGTTMIAMFHYNYQQFKSNAVPSMVYVSNNKIYDTPGRTQSPYETKEIFAMTPLSENFEGAVQRFSPRADLFLSNTGKSIQSLLIDFGDGHGYRNLSANEAIQITYDEDGEKLMRFKLTYTDNTVRESHSKIMVTNVEPGGPQARYSGMNINTFNFPLPGYPAKPYQGSSAKALVTVEYANPDKILRRPLIVVEGFDPWKIIDPGNKSANHSFSDFIINDINVTIDLPNQGKTLSDALEGENFDLIFIDFDDGTDYIQRNAYLVENIIAWVNSTKQPYAGVMQKNVVIGFSMGGLVARYALRDMELAHPTVLHDTRLYISVDSPHQGANIPLGFQAAVSHLSGVGIAIGVPGVYYEPSGLHFGNQITELGRAYKLLNSPAARQMLYYSVTGAGNSLFNDNSAHNTFMADYTAKGYPQTNGIRNLAIASGSECGANQGFQPHAVFVNFNKKVSMKGFVKYIGLGLAGAVTNYPQALIQLLPGKSNVYMQFTINALPNQSAQRVYRGRVYIKKKILWLINVTVDLFDKSYNAPASYLPLDNHAGGVNDISSIAGNLPFPINITRFNFVPTFSALDIGKGFQPITLNDLQRPHSPAFPPVAPKNVAGDNFFANPTEGGISNEIHTQITLRNGQWLFQEIIGTQAFFSCSYQCAGTGIYPYINGGPLICSSSQQISLMNAGLQSQVSWSVRPATLFTTNFGSGTVATIQPISPTVQGTAVLTYSIQGSCGTQQVSKTLMAGNPVITYNPTPGNLNPCSTNPYYSTASLNVNYQWEVDNPNIWILPPGTMYTATTLSRESEPFTISVTVSDGSCTKTGTLENQYGNALYCECFSDPSCENQGGGGWGNIAAYPNPAAEELEVQLTINPDAQKNSSDETIQVALYNSRQERIYTTSGNGRIKIPVKNFPEGIYYLSVTNNKGTLGKKIIIER